MAEENLQQEAQPKKKKGLIVAIVLLAVLIVGGATAAAIYFFNQDDKEAVAETDKKEELEDGSSNIVITEDNREKWKDMQEKVARGRIQVKMTNGWVFREGCTVSNGYLANSERNSYDLRFEITLADTGEVIMVSPDVPIGSCIENFPLDVELEPGQYDIVVAHQQVENGEVFNTVRTTGEITVE